MQFLINKTHRLAWLPLFCGFACAHPISPLQRMNVRTDWPSGSVAIGPSRGTVRGDAGRITVPDWAGLEEVLGHYDPPLDTVDAAFATDESSLLLLGRRGQVWLWDRVRRQIVDESLQCWLEEGPITSPQYPESAISLVVGTGGRIAVGYSTGHYCILESLRGKRLSSVVEPTPQKHWSLMLAHLSAERLFTYSYNPEWFLATKLFNMGGPAVGGYLRSWDVATGRLLHEVNLGRGYAAAFSPDGSHFVLQGDQLLFLDQNGRTLWQRPYHARTIEFVSEQRLLLLEANRVLTVSTRDGSLVDEVEGEQLPSSSPADLQFQQVRVAEEGRSIIVQKSYSRVEVWKTEGLKPIVGRQYLGELGLSRAAPKQGRYFLSNTSIFDIERFGKYDPPSGPIDCLVASADTARVVGCRTWNGVANIELWERNAGLPRRIAMERRAWLASSREASVLAIGQYEENVIMNWAGTTLQRLPFRASYYEPVAMSGDGQRFAVLVLEKDLRGSAIELRDVRTGKTLWRNVDHPAQGGIAARITFSDDESRLFAVTPEQHVVGLSVTDGRFLTELLPNGEGEWQLLGDLGLWRARGGRGVTAYDLSTQRLLWHRDETSSPSLNVAKRLDDVSWLSIEDTRVRRRSVESGADWASPIELGPSSDAPTQLAAARNAGWFAVGTRRGVVLRFKCREP